MPLAKKFADPGVKIASFKEAQELCGRAGRLGQVVPDAKPFVSNLYGALAGSLQAQANRSREAPPGQVATRRYRSAAQWLVRLLSQDSDAPLRVEAKVWAQSFDYDPQVLRVELDASPLLAQQCCMTKGPSPSTSPSSGRTLVGSVCAWGFRNSKRFGSSSRRS